MKCVAAVIASLAFAANLGAQARTVASSGADHAAHHPAAAAAPLTQGEIRKIDKEQGKLTLKHGPIVNLDMPAMTMVFKLCAPKMLDKLKVGDKVKFSADRIAGAITVTSIEVSR